MEYEIYKEIKSEEEFFNSWQYEDLVALTDALKKRIYDKYVLKCKILQRDGFKCQNINCKHPESKLTIHHVKHKRNGGEDKERNLVTICKICHTLFNRCKGSLTFDNSDNLPTHIRGHTFKLHAKEKEIDWKQIRVEMKKVRKELKQNGVDFSIKDIRIIIILMRFLTKPYYEFEHSDDDI